MGQNETGRNETGRQRTARQARSALAGELVVLDTETTGLGPRDEIIEISCIDGKGRVILDTLVRPGRRIHPQAQAVHGITPEDLEDQPAMNDVMDRLEPVLARADTIASYNLEFDCRLLRQSTGARYRLPPTASQFCIMEAYARHRGEWDPRFESYRWHRLQDAMRDCGSRPRGTPHGSLQNALGALDVLRHIARNR